jgi:hypothetical protein
MSAAPLAFFYASDWLSVLIEQLVHHASSVLSPPAVILTLLGT